MVTRASARSTKISIARSPRYALEGCDRIYREKASGKDMRNRPERDSRARCILEGMEALTVLAGLGHFEEAGLYLLDLLLGREIDRAAVGGIDHVLPDHDQVGL